MAPRTWLQAGVGYLVVVCCLGLGVVPALLVSRTWSGLLITVCVLAAVVPLAVLGVRLGGREGAARMVLFGVFPLLLAGFCGCVAVPDLILLARGDAVTAVITGADRHATGKGGTYYAYTLRAVDGHPIADRMETEDALPVGARVDVLVDPDGVAAPELAGSITTRTTVLTALAAVGLVVLAVVVGWAGVRGERHSRSGRRRSPST